MKLRWLLLAATVAAASGCTVTPDWEKYLPRETPRMTAARFQLALAYGPDSDSFESLSRVSRDYVGSLIKWKLFIMFAKDPETGEKVADMVSQAVVDFCFETGEDEKGRQKAEAAARYEKTQHAYTIYLFLEEDEWKVGLIETLGLEKEEEAEENGEGETEP